MKTATTLTLPEWLTEIEAIRRAVQNARRAGQTIGLVPTMGNLHEGHASLMRRARSETDFVVATIFVNPFQFCAGEDFERYPRSPDADRELCSRENVDCIFAPAVDAMYPRGALTRVQVTRLEEPLCGPHRPGHFVGVATIVAKLFNLVPADVAYFGSKDFQQAKLIQQMTRDLNFPIEVRLCPTIREPDGLAMSSRNAYLSPEDRKQATILKRALELAEKLVAQGETDAGRIRHEMLSLLSSVRNARVDYVELVHPDDLRAMDVIDRPMLAAVAVRFGGTRLIDNALISPDGA